VGKFHSIGAKVSKDADKISTIEKNFFPYPA
jgi:hypothetical protein